MRSGRASGLFIDTVELDDRFASFRDLARAFGFHAVHSMPMLTRVGEAIGVLPVHSKRAVF